MADLVDVYLKKPHRHAGVRYKAGDIITVPADSARRIEEWGAGSRVPLFGRTPRPAAIHPEPHEGS